MRSLAVLVPSDGPPPPPPESLPLARAALALGAEGVEVVFGDDVRDGRVAGLVPRPGGWERVERRAVAAAWDRFPGQSRSGAWEEMLAALGDVPVANPPAFDALCRDKLACQHVLDGHGFPPVVEDPAVFAARLAEFRVGFLKPRFGSFGHGVRRVVPGDPLPETILGLAGTPEPSLLQQAVPPPSGYAGVAIRVMVQRDPTGRWWAAEPVARWSTDDPVANAARGANVSPLRARFPEAVGPAMERSVSIARALAHRPDGDLVVELGIDLVLDPDHRVHPVEVNGKPRGRLEHLARSDARWLDAHDALARGPLRWLAARFVGPA